MTTATKLLRWIALALGAAYGALFLFSAALRLVYPYEVEWNEGAVLDHAIRILHGLPIYSAPSLDFAAFVYTPLYYYLTALLMSIGGIGLWAGRAVSMGSTLFTALLIGSIVYREALGSRNRAFLTLSAGLLYLAFYHATGFFYDIVRMDAFAVFLVIAAVHTALYVKRSAIVAAVLIVFAYFTKQQMIFAWPALALAFYWQSKHRFLWFAGTSLLAIVLGTIALNAISHGWYIFYTYTIPGAKAAAQFSWRDALEFIPTTLLGSMGIFILVILLLAIVSNEWRHKSHLAVLLVLWVLALGSASLSLGNPGGYANVLMPFVAVLAILFPLSIDRIAERFPAWSSLAPICVLLGFLALAFNPLGEIMLFASRRQRAAGNEFVQKLRAMPGEVWVPFHGYIPALAGKAAHVHFMAMNDALFPHDERSARFRREIDSVLEAHRFRAIVLDEDHVYGWDSIPHYRKSGTIFQVPNVFLSRIGSAPTRPQFIYRPN